MALPGLFGRFTSGVLGNALGYGVGSAMGPIISPPVQDLANLLWAAHPVRPVDASMAAQVAIKRPDLLGAMLGWSKQTGFDEPQLRLMMQAIDNPPGLGEMLELFRRGEIDEAKLLAGLRSSLLESAWLDEVPKLRKRFLSPEELAAMRQQGFITSEAQRARSHLQGVDTADADLLFEINGLPPGIGEGLELLRRGEIDDAKFARIVAEGHTKTKYTDDLRKLTRVPLSAAVAAEALVRERIPHAKALQIAKENGIDAADFEIYWHMLRRPIATGQAQEAVNRELVGPRDSAESQRWFHEIIARSDVSTEFAPILYGLRVHYPSLFQLRALISNGSVTDDYAREILLKQGYEAKLAEGIIQAAHSTKAQKSKDLAHGMIEDLYESGLEPKQWAVDALVALGYDPDEADLLLSLIDARRILAALRSQLNVIHRSYVNHKVDRARAMEEIDAFGVSDVARDLLLESWDAERAANVTRLTNAQIGSALKHGIIEQPDAITRWMENGYPAADAQVLAALALAAPHGASPTAP